MYLYIYIYLCGAGQIGPRGLPVCISIFGSVLSSISIPSYIYISVSFYVYICIYIHTYIDTQKLLHTH